ncbi:elongation factor Ts, mitochondrial [Coprinellus micaceus]|uniref:Elongation factor Ts, mitochondrial n=1 Tax=Coprinellus micaceus TaxID=71717 RepID=A0A4Y7TXA3_COPMI|nr:elongation factor Ts, mitochondrial [Coprinellus micaceus]
MFRNRRPRTTPALKCLYSTATEKPSLKLVAELRKRTEVSIVKAREALSASGNDIDAALEWLQKDLVASGAKKAAKVGGRATNEGLVGVSVLSNFTAFGMQRGLRAAMIELNCETDFVGRNELFGQLVADIAHTAAVISEPSGSFCLFSIQPEFLQDAPLISQSNPSAPPTGTVASAIRDTIAKVGENITLRRAMAVTAQPPTLNGTALRLASYVHGTIHRPTEGRIGALALLALRYPSPKGFSPKLTKKLETLERALGRQIVGFDTKSIDAADPHDQTALYNQPFITFADELNGQSVRNVLAQWSAREGLSFPDGFEAGIKPLDFAKWSVGEPLE